MRRTAPTPLAARPMGFLSDIHGNIEALEAVLAELDRRAVRTVYVAGDLLFGGESPLEVWRALQKVGAQCTRGTSDNALVEVDPTSLRPTNAEEKARTDLFVRTRRQVGELILEQLRRLPEVLRVPLVDGGELAMSHGSPGDSLVELSHDLDDNEMLALVGDDPADILVCGATHVPFERRLDGVFVVNVGSVGAAPEGRIAHFTVVSPRMDGTQIEQCWVEY